MKVMRLLLWLYWVIGIGTPLSLKAQELPYLRNHSPAEYKGARQNWSITQGGDQTMYIGNDQGLLQYDGGNWTLYSLEEGKSIRAVFCKGNRIYTGAYGEFGYWQKDAKGRLQYTSLNPLIKEKGFFQEEIWHITEHDGIIYFQSFAMLLAYNGISVERIATPGNIMFLRPAYDGLVLPVIGKGLYRRTGRDWQMIPGSLQLGNKTVSAIFNLDNRLMVTTLEDGVYVLDDHKIEKWRHPLNTILEKAQVNKAILLKNDLICFATINDGVWIIDLKSGNTLELNSESGLQNNTVLSLYADSGNGLWMGLDKGISYFSLSSDLLYYDGRRDRLGTIYTAEKYGKYKYLGTNQGLYRCSVEDNKQLGGKSRYSAVSQIKGQVWHLYKVNEGIICAHNGGCDLITDEGVTPLFRGNGTWYTTRMMGDPTRLIQGSYSGALVYVFEAGKWQFSHRIDGLGGAIDRVYVESQNSFWLTGPGGELRRAVLDKEMKKAVSTRVYTGKNQLSRSRRIDMIRLGNELCVHLKDSLFQYNAKEDRFEFLKPMKGHLQGPFGNQYFEIFRDSIVQVGPADRKSLFIQPTLEKNVIIPWDKDQWMVLQEEGYVLVGQQQLGAVLSQKIPAMQVDYVRSESGVLYFLKDDKIQLPFEDRSFELLFHEPIYDKAHYYSFELTGRDNIRGGWEKRSVLRFFNLNFGRYQLRIFSSSGNSRTLSIEVFPPWYMSRLMVFSYLLMLVLTGLGFWFYYNRSLEKSRLKLQEENARVLREHKIAIDNQKLMEDNRLKSQELANSTLQLIKKNELLLEIKEELVELRKTEESLTQKEFQKMMRQINENLTSEHDNKLFEANFHEIHEVFFKKLLARYPHLTSQDLKLAAYLKMNLTTKEIAPLFNITVRGLENKRYRLRTKLDLPAEVNLSEFFIAFE